MNQEQFTEMAKSTLEWELHMFPWWIKAFYGLAVICMTVTTICLPLIVWKLFVCNKPAKNQTQLTPDQRKLQQIRDRRESLMTATAEKHHITEQPEPVSVADFSASGAGVPEPLEGDSRYLPPA
jgi:hypothetical protein